jgi:hypothetical protein
VLTVIGEHLFLINNYEKLNLINYGVGVAAGDKLPDHMKTRLSLAKPAESQIGLPSSSVPA